MTFKTLFLCLALATSSSFFGCANAPPPTSLSWGGDFPALSMTLARPPKGKLKVLGNVSEKVCTLDGELTQRIGLLDSLLKKAQASKNADFIANATISRVDDSCILLIGKAVSEENKSAVPPAEDSAK